MTAETVNSQLDNPAPLGLPSIQGRVTAAVLALVWVFVSVSAVKASANVTAPELVISRWLAGLAWFSAGFTVWRKRPETAFGPAMVLVGFLLFNRELAAAGSDWMALFSFLTQHYFAIPLVWIAMAYPTGRIGGVERLVFVVILGYFALSPFVDAVTFPYAYNVVLCDFCDHHLVFFDPIALAHTTGPTELVGRIESWVTPTLVVIAAAGVVRRFVRATPAARRVLLPVWLAALTTAAYLVATAQVVALHPGRTGWIAFGLGSDFTLALTPIAFMFGLLNVGLLHGRVGRLVDELNVAHASDGLEAVMRRALKDSSARIFYRRQEDNDYFDSSGLRVDLASEVQGRAVTTLEHKGVVLGALVHDKALLEERDLVQSMAAVAAMTLANERLQAQVRAQLHEVEASRTRIVQAADAERRRIERNLHDGAQQRLVALRLDMMMSAAQVEESNPAAAEMLRTKAADLEGAIAELRELAHGIHPAVLTDEGLSAALDVLVQRARIPVEIQDKLPRRPPAAVEAVAYYVIAEGLTNIAKHALASRVTISLTWQQDEMVVVVSDNGVGGAHLDGGTGLQGLSDRVAAAGGTLEIDSPPGSGTTIRARFPVEPA